MNLNIELSDGYDGVFVSIMTISDGSEELLRISTIITNALTVQEILNLGRINGEKLTLVVN